MVGKAPRVGNGFLGFMATISLFAALSTADVTGVVSGNGGKPVAGAFVRFVNASDSTQDITAYTDAAGKYSVKLPASTATVPFGSGPRRHGWIGARIGSQEDPQIGSATFNLEGRISGFRRGMLVSKSATVPPGGARGLAKASAAGTYQALVYGKGIYPLSIRNLALSDGDSKDFQAGGVDLWDSSRTILRDNLGNCRYQFEKSKQGRVAFLGGSITFNPGWRDSVMAYLKKRFPQTTFDFINAGIPSVGSNMHAFRLQKDVFFKGKVDLLFTESLVNDVTNGVTLVERTRATEGIIRQAFRHNPAIDVVMMHFVDPSVYADVQAGKPVRQVLEYENCAWPLGVSSLNLAQHVAEKYTWEAFGANVHPGPFGQKIYADAIARLFNTAWKDPLPDAAVPAAHFVTPRMVDSLCYRLGHFVTVDSAKVVSGWKKVAAWKPATGGTRDGFTDIPVLDATAAGASLTFKFTGTALSIVVPAGPDVGMLDVTLDGKSAGTLDQFTAWSADLNIPWTFNFAADLAMKEHVLTLTTSATKNAKSTGYACHLIRFAVNGP